jgi:hypothetical protein
VEIRPVRIGDLPRLHALNQACVPEVGPVAADDWASLADLTAISLVADLADVAAEVEGSDPAGFCFVMGPGADYGSVNYRWFMERYDDAFYLDRVAVDDRYRGRGIATRMYEAVCAEIIETRPEITRLTLEVNVDPPNPVSLAFHARHGFVEVGRQMTPYGIEVALMEKVLR